MKRDPALQSLSHDHYEGLQFSARLKRSLAAGHSLPDLARDSVAFWRDHLVPHFKLEELHIVPLLEEVSPPMAARLLDEHRWIASAITAIEDEPNQDGGSLDAFAEALISHIRFEEREAFPAVEASADAETLAAIQAALETSH